MYVFYVFLRFFQNPKKHDFLRFFELLHTFSRTVPVMSHDNDNARNFTAAAAAATAATCGTIAVTPLISTWPTAANHTWLDWTQ